TFSPVRPKRRFSMALDYRAEKRKARTDEAISRRSTSVGRCAICSPHCLGAGGSINMAEIEQSSAPAPAEAKKRVWWHLWSVVALILITVLIGARLAMPYALKWYVSRTINTNPL